MQKAKLKKKTREGGTTPESDADLCWHKGGLSCVPSLGHRLFLTLCIELPLPWERTLHKSALLAVEPAEHTARLGLIRHTSCLSLSTSIAGPVSPASTIQPGLTGGGATHARRKRGLGTLSDIAVGFGGREKMGIAGGYSNRGGTSNPGRTGHSVGRLGNVGVRAATGKAWSEG